MGWGLVSQNPDIPSTLLHVHSYQQRALHRHTRDGALLSRASSARTAPSRISFFRMTMHLLAVKPVCEKQGLYNRPDGPRRRFPGQLAEPWRLRPSPLADPLADP